MVTSLNDSEAANFGARELPAHDLRYDRADEFLEVVIGHWNTWSADAIRIDKAEGLFADPDKVRRLDHHGQWFDSRGPFTVPPSPQGHPVIIQAGQSGRGRQFAVRWGEVIFAIFPTLEFGRKAYAALQEESVLLGRAPGSFRVAPLV